MKHILLGALAYLLLGFLLHRWLLTGSSYRLRIRDIILGAAAMPVIFLFLLLFIFCEKMWKRLLLMLDFEPPEEMRAGPVAPGDRKSDPHDAA